MDSSTANLLGAQHFAQQFTEIIYPNPNCTSLTQAKIFLFGVIHNNPGYERRYVQMINRLADDKSIILVEMFKSMHTLEKEECTELKTLKTPVKQIYGWDIGNAEEICNHPIVVESERCDRILKDLAAKAAIRPLTEEESRLKYNTGMDQMKAQREYWCVQDEVEELLTEKMPERTNSMISTVAKVNSLPDVSKIFLLSGHYHLQEEKNVISPYDEIFERAPQLPDPRNNLDALREFLKDKPAVIFIPK